MSNSTNESEDGLHHIDESKSLMLGGVNERNAGEVSLKKGPWTSAEDAILVDYVKKHGEGNWNAVQKYSGLSRCGKSCRLRWANHLRPNLKKGAFTAEEEQLIIELHAKMGNKWAHMATHLPGRTDNEIKNYWNTRTKRRLRGGLPLYPPELCLQGLLAPQEGEETGGIDNGDEDYDPWPAIYELIPDAIFDRFTVNQDLLPYAPELLKMSPDNLLYKGYVSSQYCSFMTPAIHREKCVQELTSIFPNSDDCVKSSVDQFVGYTCDKIAESLGSYFSYDPDIARKSTMSLGLIQGDHSLSNGNSSVSKPLTGEEKSELPSLQFAKTNFGSWEKAPLPHISGSVDAFIQFPSSNSVIGSDCSSQGNSGLLDALLHEADSVCIAKDHSTGNNLGPGNVLPTANFNIYETEWKDYIEPPTPFGHSGHQHFTEYTPISSSGSSFEEFPLDAAFSGSILNTELLEQAWWLEKEKKAKDGLNFAHPGTLLVSDWLEQNSELVDDRSNMSSAVAMLDGDDMDADYAAMAAGTSTPCTTGWEMSCCAWNNAPDVCRMGDPPQ